MIRDREPARVAPDPPEGRPGPQRIRQPRPPPPDRLGDGGPPTTDTARLAA